MTLSSWSQGSGYPIPVSQGYYSGPVDSTTVTHRYTQTPCPPGQYCIGGVSNVCAAGRYGDVPALYTLTCSGDCAGGYYCGTGAVTATETPCGNNTVYCPPGAAAPTLAVPGQLTIGDDEQHRNGTELCPERHYCVNGVATPCPPGRFGCATGLKDSDCNGACVAGYFCPTGSASNRAVACGNSSVYCPDGVGEPVVVDEGYYAVGGLSSLQRTAQALCPPGAYCVDGVKVRRR